MKKVTTPTWIIHCTYPDEPHMDYQADFHTHGLDKYNHPEIAIVVSIPAETAGAILNTVGLRIANGERFDIEGKRYDVLADNFPVQFVKTTYGKEDIMVMILPDEQRRLPEDTGCMVPYNKQFELLQAIKEMYE